MIIRLRCIRPPKSHPATDNFLKTSVCTDSSQHIHETNGIVFFILNQPDISFLNSF